MCISLTFHSFSIAIFPHGRVSPTSVFICLLLSYHSLPKWKSFPWLNYYLHANKKACLGSVLLYSIPHTVCTQHIKLEFVAVPNLSPPHCPYFNKQFLNLYKHSTKSWKRFKPFVFIWPLISPSPHLTIILNKTLRPGHGVFCLSCC